MTSQTEVAEAPTHKDPQPSPVSPPSPPRDNSPNGDSAPTPDYKRITKIAISVIVYGIAQGFLAGLHSGFIGLNAQDFFGLSPFWQTILRDTANGGNDGLQKALTFGLAAWAGPDVLNVFGTYIGFALRKTATVVRILSRAVQGKDENDAPVDPSKK
jgi:hypothetical protein